MNDFEFDELIEVSDNHDFRDTQEARFMVDYRTSKQDWHGSYPIVVINKEGLSRQYGYARKRAPKVMVVLYSEGSTAQTRQIPQSLADKILAGDI
jgi:hypothetical protein